MTALIPNSQTTNGVETYEDMFKEITRKLYGEETSHGLHTLGTPVAHIASGTTANIPDGERSFTTLVSVFSFLAWSSIENLFFFSTILQSSERNVGPIDYEQTASGIDGNSLLKNDDHLTAFGLALMQNGFPTHNSILNSHPFHQMNKQPNLPNTNNLNQSNGNMNQMANHQHNDGMQEKWSNPQQNTNEMNAWKTNNYQAPQKHFK